MIADIIIDCDPGQDDAIALLMAMGSVSLNILGITTVAGNVSCDLTFENAIKICARANRTDIGVYKGCDRPLKKELVTAEHIHGESGLSCKIDISEIQKNTLHAVDFLIKTLREVDHKITIVATAALTNIAVAITKAPDIKDKIERIVLMGGSATGGNITPYAEFNFFTDPHAAEIVFNSNIRIVMIGLDTTVQTMFDEVLVDRIGKIKNKVSDCASLILSDLLFTNRNVYHTNGGILHDGCVIAYLNDPELFTLKKAHVKIETLDARKIGASYVSFDDDGDVLVATKADKDGIFDMIEKLLKNFH